MEKVKKITSAVLLSVDESDEVYPLVLNWPGELNWSQFFFKKSRKVV